MTFFSLATTNEGSKTLSVMYADGDIISVPQNHPNFDNILDLLQSGEAEDESVKVLVNTLVAIGEKLAKLSDRVSVNTWGVYFDHDPLRGELADTILSLYKEGDEKALVSLVRFLEKASTNPNKDSIDALYRWITNEKLTITEDGDFIGYKGVMVTDGEYTSIHSGSAFVNGELRNGRISYPVGAVIEMPRSEVDPSSSAYCSVGLHVGTWNYALDYACGDSRVMVKVLVHPRDVVMVPGDSNEKMRVCRYIILEAVEKKEEKAVVNSPQPLTWREGQLVRLQTSQGLTRVFAERPSSGVNAWLDGGRVVEVFDIFKNGRNSKGHFVKGFTPEGMVRDSTGRFVKA